ncbi:DNA helicase/exodeoxyribonuclease V beta subunit [Streptomyces sp. 2333.5]|uniref:ATP-dependent helicase n=1 Tax=unclassified Streptomyces TaxID=2593676 RepID=UPI000895A202|nr:MULTISPECIES: ATP-dependent DNA helicase [unclassified Streptomyces]PJJ04335.1 DNA helicase/exodeoxyribonuclease V beta subunit [Streptomyces sp. 2333.5]SEE47849.1 Superfamily I DNA or RNA helicase [Streptomyces sp. 2314.4]SEE74761.1 Superfamily I DNA or RNA helicase [Streptomyces sp. 2112.2]
MSSSFSAAPPTQPHRAARRDAAGAYRLVRTAPERVDPPALDAAQRAVVDHRHGPLLVLAGPGTGKTTTLVESVVRRVRAGDDPERILVLTFSRKAAVELRDRLAARLSGPDAPPAGPAVPGGGPRRPGIPQATTFHSFCYALVRAHQDAELFADPLRLLSGPEQDLVVRELLEGQAELAGAGRGRVRWPDELRACLTTRGFADEVRAVLARSRELGLGPDALGAFAARTGRPDWSAAASFLAEYLDVLDAQGVLDYAELVHRAVLLAEHTDTAAQLAAAYDAVYVDEYQDTDAAQVRLLRALAGNHTASAAPGSPGRTLVAFGDPDQSIYAFRGADVNGILDFPETFRRGDGTPAPVAVLGTSRRSGAALLAATRLLTRRMPLTRLPAAKVRAHREPVPVRDGGRVEAYTYPTSGAELDNIADILRRAHLEDGVPWREMAVLVRAGGRSLPAVRRALTSAGVPLDIDGDDLPLRHEPAVAPLLTALRAAARAALRHDPGATPDAPSDEAAPEDAGPGQVTPDDAGPGQAAPDDAAGAPGWLDAETATDLLTSPLGGMDSADLRRLGRALREEERSAGQPLPRPSDELIARALAEPQRLVAHDPGYARGAQRLGLLLRKARALLAGGGTAEQALWELWDGTPWPQRLERAAHRGGAAGRNADRDLDAVVALFETAARAEERTGGRGALNFLEELDAQDIAADTLTRRAVRPDAVRLMTAHRAKGLEWRLVVVAGVQEGLWPDLRRRGSLLEADRIGRDGLAEPLPAGALLAEERRLFYVAATRARERLVVTAVEAAADDGDQPSRFLTELGVTPQDVTGRPRRPLSVAALVAELRATTVDPAATPALREAAAQRLAQLAALRDDDHHPLVPAAHPDTWWGLHDPTHSSIPLRDRDRPVVLSGSALDQLAHTCSLQWFLGREVKADTPATAAQGFGNVVHVLADEVASGRTLADLAVLMERLDSVWDALAFDAPWKSRQEKDTARAALERFLRWHVMERETRGRDTVATEHGFDLTLQAGAYEVRIRGSMDHVSRDAQGRAYVVDFKTGKQKPTGPEVARHPQLAVYQLAVREGALDDAFDGQTPDPGGAELVHLRLGAPQKEGGDALPAVQAQQPLEGEWVGELLATAAGRVLEERFTPTTGTHCTHCTFRASCSAQPEGRHVVE